MDPFLLIVAFIIYWVVKSAKAAGGRRPAGGEPGPRAGSVEDGVSEMLEEGQRRALEALRRWEERQRAASGAPPDRRAGAGEPSDRAAGLPAARPTGSRPTGRVVTKPPSRSPAAPRTRPRFEEPTPGRWDEAPEAESLEAIEGEEGRTPRAPRPTPSRSPAAAVPSRARAEPRVPPRPRPAPRVASVSPGARRAGAESAGAAPGPLRRGRTRDAFAGLRGRDALQRAVLLREILGPPLALREADAPRDR